MNGHERSSVRRMAKRAKRTKPRKAESAQVIPGVAEIREVERK